MKYYIHMQTRLSRPLSVSISIMYHRVSLETNTLYLKLPKIYTVKMKTSTILERNTNVIGNGPCNRCKMQIITHPPIWLFASGIFDWLAVNKIEQHIKYSHLQIETNYSILTSANNIFISFQLKLEENVGKTHGICNVMKTFHTKRNVMKTFRERLTSTNHIRVSQRCKRLRNGNTASHFSKSNYRLK